MTLDQLLDAADQLVTLAEQTEWWDSDTRDTAYQGALGHYQEIDQRLRAGEAYPTQWQTGR